MSNMTQLEGNVIVAEQEQSIDYERIAASQDFKQLLSEKKKFIASYTIFFMAYALLLPFLAFYTDHIKSSCNRRYYVGLDLWRFDDCDVVMDM